MKTKADINSSKITSLAGKACAVRVGGSGDNSYSVTLHYPVSSGRVVATRIGSIRQVPYGSDSYMLYSIFHDEVMDRTFKTSEGARKHALRFFEEIAVSAGIVLDGDVHA